MADPPQNERLVVRRRQQGFYRSLLDHVPGGPDADHLHICATWQKVSGADWVWLWLHNPNTDSFELTCCAPNEESGEPVLPGEREAPGRTSVAAYSVRLARPVFVDDLHDWRGEIDGVSYRVTTAASLESIGCAGFECVPLQVPHPESDDAAFRTIGVVSLHWRDLGRRVQHSRGTFGTMGRLTALCIRNTQMTGQRAILVRLNRMAQQYVTRPNRRPAQVRADYLASLIRLIQEVIHVGQVSIFYEVPFADTVECIATTGLCDAQGNLLKPNELNRVVYRAYEGLTGCCFASGEPILVRRPTEDGRFVGKSREERRVIPKAEHDDPVLLTPIPGPSGDDSKKTRAQGVIRCTEHCSPVWPSELCHFEPTEMQTLRFIADQVSPVLQRFAQRIARERSISVVKHDLITPLGMIRDVIHDVIHATEHGLPVGEHDFENIQACAFLALNLAGQLDPQPGEIRKLHRQPTMLEGGIVARLCKLLRRYARMTNDLEIRFDGFRSIPRLDVDAEQIERALFNLLLNAIKYGKRGSLIQVIGERGESGFLVHVSNEGMGVTAADEDRIFDAGFRATAAARKAQGLGLGLAIARQIMRAHGGDVLITSRRDPTTFTLAFPNESESTG